MIGTKRQTFSFSSLIVLILLNVAAAAAQALSSSLAPFACPPISSSVLACTAGCWKSSLASSAACEPVGAGYYSPANDNRRYQCPAGSFAASDGIVSSCRLCPPGSFADTLGSSQCHYCPVGSYNSQSGAVSCTACDSTYYHGIGSDAVALTTTLSSSASSSNWTGLWYCLAPLHLPGVAASTPPPTVTPGLGGQPTANRVAPTLPSQSTTSTLPRSTLSPSPPPPPPPSSSSGFRTFLQHANVPMLIAVLTLGVLLLLLGVYNCSRGYLARFLIGGGFCGCCSWFNNRVTHAHDPRRSENDDDDDNQSSSATTKTDALSTTISENKSTASATGKNGIPHNQKGNLDPEKGHLTDAVADQIMRSGKESDDEVDDDDDVESTCSSFRGVYLTDTQLHALSRATGLEFGLDHEDDDENMIMMEDPSIAAHTGYGGAVSIWSVPAASVVVQLRSTDCGTEQEEEGYEDVSLNGDDKDMERVV